MPADAIPDIDSFEGAGADDEDEYSALKRYQRHLEYVAPAYFLLCVLGGAANRLTKRYLNLQEEYIKDEQRSVA